MSLYVSLFRLRPVTAQIRAFRSFWPSLTEASSCRYRYALSASDDWPAAFTNLGTLHVQGLGVPGPDIEAARRLWLKAAALGNETAMFNLGVLAEKGMGGPVDLDLAKRRYARGAERKDVASAAALKRLGG